MPQSVNLLKGKWIRKNSLSSWAKDSGIELLDRIGYTRRDSFCLFTNDNLGIFLIIPLFLFVGPNLDKNSYNCHPYYKHFAL